MRTLPTPRALLGRAALHLTVSDPGQLRLRSALSTAVTFTVALAVLLAVNTILGQPIPVTMLGTVVAMFTTFVVRDDTARARLITCSLCALPAVGAVSLAALLTDTPRVADTVFIVVLFCAVWVRRFGPRGFALGMAAFVSYFFALFLRATEDLVPHLALSVLVGVAVAVALRATVFRERPGAELARLASALRATCGSVIAASSDRPAATVRRRLDRLGVTALMIEDWLDRNRAGPELSRTVFDVQQATEQLTRSLAALGGPARSPALQRSMNAVHVVLRDDAQPDALADALATVRASESGTDTDDVEAFAVHYASRTVLAHVALHRMTLRDITDRPETDEPPDEDESPADAEGSWAERLNYSTRSAIQVAVAGSAATFLGALVSPGRWYWAVLSAFVVFTGTSTRGEILTRAGHRIVGTIAGVVAGVGISLLVGDHRAVQLTLIVVCVFCAFYLVTVANSLLVFFLTVLLAMLYGLLGTFSVAVLELRVAETAVGAAVGMAAAYFVLPVRTRETVVDTVYEYLDRLVVVVTDSVDTIVAAPEVPRGASVLTSAREMDTALQAVVTAAGPLEYGLTARARRGTARLLSVLEACDRAARTLARSAVAATEDTAPRTMDPAVEAVLRDGCAEVLESVAALRNTVHGVAPDDTDDDARYDFARRPVPPGHIRGAVRALDRLAHASTMRTFTG